MLSGVYVQTAIAIAGHINFTEPPDGESISAFGGARLRVGGQYPTGEDACSTTSSVRALARAKSEDKLEHTDHKLEARRSQLTLVGLVAPIDSDRDGVLESVAARETRAPAS